MESSSGPVKVIIVGAGFAGLTAAIECQRKGHSVTVFEKIKDIKPLGDIISFGQNSSRMFKKWPGVVEKLLPIIHTSQAVNFFDSRGNYITTQSFAEEEEKWGMRINGHRGEIHKILLDYAKSVGIEIRLGHNVTGYFEDEACGGIEVDGERITADVVLSAEGVRAPGRRIVLGSDDLPRPSGYAVYRAWFPSTELINNPLTKHLVGGDTHSGWIGEDVHFLAAAIKNGAEISWVCTHKDDSDIEESWQFPGKVDEVLKVLEGWDPVVQELVKATPPDRLFDYKLVFRDPLPTFISPKRRIVLIGDAAHPFLPTSIQGASQAMEDGAVIAACLDISGRYRVTDAVRVYEKIRYDRVHRIQATGVTTREQWHKADWSAIRNDPTLLHLKRDQWVLDFDAEEDTYNSYAKIASSL
ncbi:FAD/NAD(P)-binding domain-containing protein [Coniochaeta ligniaria NRRL 30616]|uniref:FAD/NAD(P)-binding domain-containing protein n=1 Tax=Coniochaeta ligniaria NRRL 30616 TaxID=1408157 RepID=A0A1J7J7B8_9PEZI|nr:FAD/NAD(P)-binding domain-containing protein [Coniochaeta ligniaria NRRL 30616]